MKIKLLLTLYIFQSSYCKVAAQAYYMHEANEDGSLIDGILGMLLIFCIIWIILKCIDSSNKINKQIEQEKWEKELNTKLMEERLNENPNKYKYQNNPNWKEGYLKAYTSNQIEILYNKTIDDLLSEYQKIDSNSEKAKEIMRKIGYYQYWEWKNEELIRIGKKPFRIINTQCQYLDDIEFEKECIRIYGDYAELLDFCIIIFEDGVYRVIHYKDRRYQPLKKFITNKHRDRICIANKYIGGDRLLLYFFAGKMKYIPQAKKMEQHGFLEKRFLGSCYFALLAYYEDTLKTYGGRGLKEFIIYLGMENSIYLHKMLKKPLSPYYYYELKMMEKLCLSASDYIKYKRNNHWQKKPDGIYDGYFGFLGRDDKQAKETIKLKLGFSFDDVKKEVENMTWHL